MALYVLGAVLAAAAAIGLFLFARVLRRRQLAESLRMSLFLIKIPQDIPREGGAKDFKSEIGLTEQLLSGLAALRKPFVLEVAVPHIGEEIRFFLAVPKSLSEIAAKQIQGIWNGASVEAVRDDYTIFNAQGASAGAYLVQKENAALPMRTYAEIGQDTLSTILGGFSKVNDVGEGAALQIIVRPAQSGFKGGVQKYLTALKKGESFEKVLGHANPFSVKEISHALNPQKVEELKQERIVDEEAVKALQMKIAKPLFHVNVRALASAGSAFQANDILDGILAGFEQFASPQRNEFRAVKPKNPKNLIAEFIFREWNDREAMTLTSEEIAGFWHLPTSGTETPHVKWLKSREAPPPANLPASGVLVGKSSFRGESNPVYITDEDRRRHIYVVGQTGTGKSTLLANMIIQDIEQGKGVCMVDPHGDLVQGVLGRIPRERLDDLIYFDPADTERPLGLNMLDYNQSRPEEKTFIVNEMQSIFNKLFSAETMGPMFEQYMRNALLLLMEDMANEPATLIEVPRVFTDSEYRRRKLARIKNPIVIDFWEKEAVKAGGEASLANMTPYITSKFNNFISNDYMRPIIGQPRSAFNFRAAMDEGKILLINLSKGRIGDINAGLLGMVITGKLLMAALSRVDVPDAKRRDFNLYIDEFQNFTTDSISTILSEARKYRLNLTMAHQFIAQLTEKIRDAVFGNVGSQIVFRVGATDAEFLVKQFTPVFTENDLLSIDNLNAYAKILIHGQTSKPFNIRIDTTSWTPVDAELTEKLKEYSRARYGAAREAVESDIYRRLRE